MALKSTIFKAQLQIADIDHGYYAEHALTLARHPSETDERMMVRIVALALHAHQLQDVCRGDGKLAFGAGLSDPDDPDVALTDFTGRKRLWIEVGQPDDRALTKASAQADSVNKVSRLDRLQVWRLPADAAPALVELAERSMQLQATVQDGALTLSSAKGSVHVEPQRWQ